jgi:hypothetical protein
MARPSIEAAVSRPVVVIAIPVVVGRINATGISVAYFRGIASTPPVRRAGHQHRHKRREEDYRYACYQHSITSAPSLRALYSRRARSNASWKSWISAEGKEGGSGIRKCQLRHLVFAEVSERYGLRIPRIR